MRPYFSTIRSISALMDSHPLNSARHLPLRHIFLVFFQSFCHRFFTGAEENDRSPFSFKNSSTMAFRYPGTAGNDANSYSSSLT